MTVVDRSVEAGDPPPSRLRSAWAGVAFPVWSWLAVAVGLVGVVWASEAWLDPNVPMSLRRTFSRPIVTPASGETSLGTCSLYSMPGARQATTPSTS